MRVYVATTPEAIKNLLSGTATFEDYLTPDQFEFDAKVDEEEREYLISMLAADDSLEINKNKASFVIAADLKEEQINGEPIILEFKQVAALLFSNNGQELSWFAPQEIEQQLNSWL